jgi:hypothetical protein
MAKVQEEMNNLEWYEKLARGWLIGQEGRDPYAQRFATARQLDEIARQNAQAKQQAKNNFHNYNLDQERFKHRKNIDRENLSINQQRAENDNLQLQNTLAQQAAQRQQWNVANQNADRNFNASQSAPVSQIYDPATGQVTGHITASGEQVMYDTPYADAKTVKTMQPDTSTQVKYDEKTAAVQSFIENINDYQELIKENGSELVGENAAKMEALLTGLRMNYKNMEALGAIQGADMEILNQMIPDMTGIGGVFTRSDSALSKLDMAKELAIKNMDNYSKQLGSKVKPTYFNQNESKTDASQIESLLEKYK